jgi:hypothetical protein
MSDSALRQRTTASSINAQKPSSPDAPSDIRPAVASSVIAKLLFFTLLLVTVPLGSYFISIRTFFNGNATYAGALAALMANVVLLGYLVVAIQEDQGDQLEMAKEAAKKGEKKSE